MALEGSLDLFVILVNYVFGSIWLSGVGILVALFIIGVFGKMSPMLIIFILGTFSALFITGYLGSIGFGLFFIVGALYFSIAVLNYINTRKYYG